MKKRKIFIILGSIVLFGVLCFIYAHFEYTNIKIKEITLESPKVNSDGIRVMYITDFQFDTRKGVNTKALRKVIDTANQQKAGLLFLGGDFVNYRRNQPAFYEVFRDLRIPELGAYAVPGNHDYYSFNQNLDRFKSLGIRLLINESVRIPVDSDYFQVVGVEDLWFGSPDIEESIRNIDGEHFTFFLAHNPDYFVDDLTRDQRRMMDFTLSGHTHAGQVTFFGLLGKPPLSFKNSFKYRYGLHRLDGAPIYVSSGVGGSAFGYFIRFFARPEIVIINVKGSGSPGS